MKHSIFRATNTLFLRHWFLPFLAIALICGPVIAYDNRALPKFEIDTAGRHLNGVKIHPDGDRWLISECTDPAAPTRFTCNLFLYNRRSKAYQRYDLPSDYMYVDAQFSPSGQWVVAVRTRISQTQSREEKLQNYTTSEIVMFRVDGTGFRILPIPKGQIKNPAMSPDERKVAFWVSDRIRPHREKTVFMHFDIHEFDLKDKKDTLFTGPHQFFLADGLQYKTQNEIIAGAYGPSAFASDMNVYQKEFGSSEIYSFRRGEKIYAKPIFSTIPSARSPGISANGRTYLIGQPKPHGMSIIETNGESITRYWRVPPIGENGIDNITASPDGSYIVFLYSTTPIRSNSPKHGLGIFDLSTERWIPARLPPLNAAASLRVRD